MAEEERAATAEEQAVLARWSSWGALPEVFDEHREEWAAERAQLKELLNEQEYGAARRTTINAHYTGPGIAREMWSSLEQLGFTGGRVLEPGAGSGVFIGLAPASAQMTGVELDTTTARIAAALYPSSTIRAESFADSDLRDGSFDAAVGNVPFANISLHDPRHNAGNHSLHNHFIIKSLALTRPGGMVAVLTSTFTLDAQNPSARREMQSMADLVGAVRLPESTHQRSAGTRVVTDLLIFRKRSAGETPQPFDWEDSTKVDVDGKLVGLSDYYVAHPERVLGELSSINTQYGGDSLTVKGDLEQLPEQLHAQLGNIIEQARGKGLTWTPLTAEQTTARDQEASLEATATDLWDGTYVERDGQVYIAQSGQLTTDGVPKGKQALRELRALIGLRDGARSLMEQEASSAEDTPSLDEQRAELLARYEDYKGTYGPLNRYTLYATGRQVRATDPATGDELVDENGQPIMEAAFGRRLPQTVRKFADNDQYGALVLALENFDDETQEAHPAHVLVGRVLTPRHQRDEAETPAEAVALALDQRGKLDLPYLAGLLHLDEATTREQLGTLVFDDPETGTLVPAPEYLSGNVRIKLAAARTAAQSNPAVNVNVEALEAVIPPPIPMEDIQARMGAVWISPNIHRRFLDDILRDPNIEVANPLPGTWMVKGNRSSLRSTEEWGTNRRPATMIAEALMNQQAIVVKDKLDDGREIFNPVETAAAQAKAEAMQERFTEWLWEDPRRAAHLAEVYNVKFNSIVLRDYTTAGEHLTFPGLTRSLTLQPHQKAAVARMISEPTVGLFHQVGAGKTFEMVAGVSELKRLGMISKPLIVVPNHMLGQFSREWLQAYPQASLLVASSKDVTAENRRRFVARAATNDWDGIVMTQSSFQSISVSADFQAEYIENELSDLRAALTNSGDDRLGTKKIEAAIARAEERLKKATDRPSDSGLTFDEMGVDYLVVDEAHMYKNLDTPSKIQGAGITNGSGKARDLHIKLELLRSRHGDRVATLATATPLSNSITEAYVMQRYLRPDLLQDAGVTSFDGWAATFGQVVTEMEMGPAGGFRIKDRFARFQNVPEMLRMWHVFADVKTAEDLKLPVPAIAPRPSDGKREAEIVVIAPTPELEAYMEDIGERAKLVADKAVRPDEDNMLKISGDGRKAALDLRMIDPDQVVDERVKLDAVADQIESIWQQTRDNEYLDPATSLPSPVTGGLQMVFCDLGTPGSGSDVDRWSAYSELRHLLVERGMEPGKIRFMHEAKNDQDKTRMFAAARAGHISVLIGSTQKMGVGTNAQDRVVAMHHVDCPWRPADLEQRDGRGIRRGNQNKEVRILRYVTERSFDAYQWQTVMRKAKFIAQVMRGRLDSREIEDVGDTALSAAEARALAAADPNILEKANADAEYQKLHRQQVAHSRAQASLAYTQTTMIDRIEQCESALTAMHEAEGRTVDTSGDKFVMQIGEHRYTSRADAAVGLSAWLVDPGHRYDYMGREQGAVFGSVGGHELVAGTMRRGGTLEVMVSLKGVPLKPTALCEGWQTPDLGVGHIRVLENKAQSIPQNIVKVELRLSEARRTLAESRERLGLPFAKQAELEAAKVRVDRVDAVLARKAGEESMDTTMALTDALGRPSDQATAQDREAHSTPSASGVIPPNLPQHPPVRGTSRFRPR